MPRRNRPTRPRIPRTLDGKPKKRKRPRAWHRGRDQDRRYLDAVERWGEAA